MRTPTPYVCPNLSLREQVLQAESGAWMRTLLRPLTAEETIRVARLIAEEAHNDNFHADPSGMTDDELADAHGLDGIPGAGALLRQLLTA